MNFPYLNEFGLLNSYLIPNTKTGYTLSATDLGKLLICNPGSTLTITIPIGLPQNFYCGIVKVSDAADVLLTGASGVVLNSASQAAGDSTITTEFEIVNLVSTSNNFYTASGFGIAGSDASAVQKIYAANFTQSGTAAPVPTLFLNQLSGAIVWTRNSVGNYTGTLAGAFPAAKTPTQAGLVAAGTDSIETPNLFRWGITRLSDNAITLVTLDGTGTPSDDALTAAFISFVVFV